MALDPCDFVDRALPPPLAPLESLFDAAAPSEVIISRASGESARWGVGRAGMLYRDLVPSRAGGALIASHIPGDFTKGAELDESQIKEIINFLSIKDLSDNNFEKIEKIAGDNQTILDGVNELILIKKYFSLLKFENFIFDPTVVRGLEYYTGPIFEANLTFGVTNNKGEEIEFGSIGGGGRYDDLIKRFNNQDCPSTGISVGLDRLIYAILQKNKIKVEKQTPVLICVFDEKYMDYYVKILNILRTKNISAEIYSGNANIKSQLKYADKRGCNYVILCGDDEVSKNSITIKNLEIGKKMSNSLKDRDDWKESSGSQKTVALDQLLNEIK